MCGKINKSACLILVFFVAAIGLVLYTGCRPSEAAWIVINKAFEPTPYDFFHAEHHFIALMPKEFTKTHRSYRWIVP